MLKDNAFKKTRIAPTPNAYLHLGNVLSFAITAALAHKTGAKLLLRIDDVDRERTNKIYVQDIFDTLNFLEIPWDEGPKDMAAYENEYSQMHRLDMYNSALAQLKEKGALFACTCSRAEVMQHSPEHIYMGTCRHKNIPFDTGNVNWRVDTSGCGKLMVRTLHRITTRSALPPIMNDFVVKRRDGFPAYQLTSLIDDLYFGVDLVVRGEDLWPSTLAQQYLARQLGDNSFEQVVFYHHPLLLDENGHKLSKSLGATSIQYFRKQHKKPADIYGFIAHILGVEIATDSWSEMVELLDMKLGIAG